MRRWFTGAWIAVVVAVAGLETLALTNDIEGDTASEIVWVLLEHQPWLAAPIVMAMVWVTWHWVRRP